MYMTNEEWEQNNQDYLKESYENFSAGSHQAGISAGMQI